MNDESRCTLKDATLVAISLAIICVTLAISAIIVLRNMGTSDPLIAGTVGTAFGYLISEAKAVSGWWFGSTRASADKDKTIASFTNQPTPTPPPTQEPKP